MHDLPKPSWARSPAPSFPERFPIRHRNNTNKRPIHHPFISALSYSVRVMRWAFVIRLGPTTKPHEGRFEGLVEEVDTGMERRFCSKEELLKFIGERFTNAVCVGEEDDGALPKSGDQP